MAEGKISLDALKRILLPDSWELYECDHATGSFLSVPLGGITRKEDLDRAFEQLLKDPETKDKHFVRVKCTRRIIGANFDFKRLIGLRKD